MQFLKSDINSQFLGNKNENRSKIQELVETEQIIKLKNKITRVKLTSNEEWYYVVI